MTYNPNIPVGKDSPANQQAQIKTNFSQFPTIFSSTALGVVYNHTAINTANQGKHEAIILTQQTADPTIDNDFVSLYAKTAVQASGNSLQIFERIQQFKPTIPNDPIQLTFSTVNVAGPQYQSFLPGGYILYVGSESGTAINANNLAFNITVSPTPSILLTPIAATNTSSARSGALPGQIGCKICTNITAVNKFTITMESPYSTLNPMAPFKLTWMAIGKV